MQTTLPLRSRETKWAMEKIQTGIYMSSETGTVYETDKFSVEPDTKNSTTTSNSGKPYARWGKDNFYPQRLIDTVNADPAASLLERRIHMHWGKGLFFYRKRIDKQGNEVIEVVPDEQVPAEIDDFMWQNDFLNFQQGIISDYEWWHRYAVQYIASNDTKIRTIEWTRVKDVRAELRDKKTGRINNYYVSGNWPDPAVTDYRKVPALDRLGKGSGMYMHQLVNIDKDYYPQPAWHGINKWLHIAAKIPRWILANIDNSMNIKYHVKIPLEYFMKRHPIDAYKTGEERLEAIAKFEQETYKNIDKFLAGAENAQKAFYSKVAVDDQGHALPGWEIIVLDNKLQDEAWLRAYGTAALAITSGVGLQPSIAGYVLPNGLGSGSGSDLREQYNFSNQVLFGIGRQTTLEPFNFVKRRNGWDPTLHLGYKEVVLQSTDQNKSGYAVQNEEAPTSDKAQTKDPMTV